MRAALHTHRLETGAAALGVLNYASKATEISVQRGVSADGALERAQILSCLLPPTSTPEHT